MGEMACLDGLNELLSSLLDESFVRRLRGEGGDNVKGMPSFHEIGPRVLRVLGEELAKCLRVLESDEGKKKMADECGPKKDAEGPSSGRRCDSS